MVLFWNCERGTLTGRVIYVRTATQTRPGRTAIRLQGLAVPE